MQALCWVLAGDTMEHQADAALPSYTVYWGRWFC